MSDDVLYEGTTPPDGVRKEGDKPSLRSLWEGAIRDSPNALVEMEELIACDDSARHLRHVFDAEPPSDSGVRAVDVIRVADDKITDERGTELPR